MANPFMSGPTKETLAEENLPTFKEYGWDFDTDSFKRDENGNLVILEGNEAIKVWVYKCLKTERYRYRAYFDDYGAELERFIGHPNDGQEGTELYRYVQEALLVNPYIRAVGDISISEVGKKIILNVKLNTIYSDDAIGVEV